LSRVFSIVEMLANGDLMFENRAGKA
jgi:hypothetical protein